jgi:gamma-glutamyl-gamma-aminobutyrate hydrolase PuuD
VHVAEGSMLSKILPSGAFFDVPTHHHQAIDLIGDGLAAVAWEEDGLIEAVEAGPSALGGLPGFVLGVQWHPEQGDDPRLFSALVTAAAERAASGASGFAPMV